MMLSGWQMRDHFEAQVSGYRVEVQRKPLYPAGLVAVSLASKLATHSAVRSSSEPASKYGCTAESSRHFSESRGDGKDRASPPIGHIKLENLMHIASSVVVKV
jgi:hypothetical protein